MSVDSNTNRGHTSADQFGNVAVAGHFAARNLLHCAEDCVEEGFGFRGAGHGPRSLAC